MEHDKSLYYLCRSFFLWLFNLTVPVFPIPLIILSTAAWLGKPVGAVVWGVGRAFAAPASVDSPTTIFPHVLFLQLKMPVKHYNSAALSHIPATIKSPCSFSPLNMNLNTFEPDIIKLAHVHKNNCQDTSTVELFPLYIHTFLFSFFFNYLSQLMVHRNCSEEIPNGFLSRTLKIGQNNTHRQRIVFHPPSTLLLWLSFDQIDDRDNFLIFFIPPLSFCCHIAPRESFQADKWEF